jgi:hypothetical protein
MSHVLGKMYKKKGILRSDTEAYQEDTTTTANVTYYRWEASPITAGNAQGDLLDSDTGLAVPIYLRRLTVAAGITTREATYGIWSQRASINTWAPMPMVG